MKSIRRAISKRELLLLGLGRSGGAGCLGSLSLGHTLLEFVHAAGSVDKFLHARVKRVADVADTDQNRFPCGTGLDHVATGATNFCIVVIRMGLSFHTKAVEPAILGKLLQGPIFNFLAAAI